jgi:hypothetical protein
VPLLLLVGNAQLDGVLVLGFGLSWHLLRSGREGWAGAALGLALVKPHVALGVAAGLLVAQRWRVLFGWALAAGVLVTVACSWRPDRCRPGRERRSPPLDTTAAT